MDVQVALQTISALADGINPETGEVLAPDSCFNQAPVLRALFVARQSLEHQLQAQKRKKSLPPNAGKPWTSEEESKLAASYEAGVVLKELCHMHGRTRGSIVARLEKLGKSIESV